MNSILSVRLPADLRKRLQAASRAEGKPVSDLIHDFICKELDIIESHVCVSWSSLRRSQGYLHDEDVYRLIFVKIVLDTNL
jgi:predicted DNA-binding protein